MRAWIVALRLVKEQVKGARLSSDQATIPKNILGCTSLSTKTYESPLGTAKAIGLR